MAPDLQTALASGELSLLLWTAAALGLIHTILGPDHYVPFVMMAKAEDWSRRKLLAITAVCGFGHVAGSIFIAALLILGGSAVLEESSLAAVQGARSSIAAWLLMGMGAAVGLWGIVRALRGRKHAHLHKHEGEPVHVHEHDHTAEHMHAHVETLRRLTPWLLFTIFVFGPCESLIPLMLAAWAAAGLAGSVLIAVAFSATTVLTIVGVVAVLHRGISLVPFGRLERWSTAVAGGSLVLCGACIQFLGV